MFRHTFYTWLLSNLLHPVLLLIVSIIMNEAPDLSATEYFTFYVYFLIASLITSLPCLFIGWVCLFIISNSPNPVDVKFILWLLIGPALAFCECITILAIFHAIEKEVLLFTLPAVMAVGSSILIRYPYFKIYFEPRVNVEI